MFQNTMKARQSDAVLAFLVETADNRFPDDAGQALRLAEALKASLLPALKHRVRINLSALSPRDEPFFLAQREIFRPWTECFNNSVCWYELVPDPKLEKAMPVIVAAIAENIDGDRLGKNPPAPGGNLAKVYNWARNAVAVKRRKTENKPEIPSFREGVDYEFIDARLPSGNWLVKMKTPAFLDAEGAAMDNLSGTVRLITATGTKNISVTMTACLKMKTFIFCPCVIQKALA